MLQAPIGRLAFEKLMLPEPATAVTVPPQVFVTPGVEATTRPAGNVSVKLASTAIVFGLFTANVSVEEAFTATVVGLKLFTMRNGSTTEMLAVTVCWSTVASALPLPEAPPALKVAVACAAEFSVSGCAWGIVPRIALLNVMGRPTSTSRFPASVAAEPLLSLLRSPVSVVLVLILMTDGLAVFVNSAKGVKLVVPALRFVIVPDGVLVPHQLAVAFTVPWSLSKLLLPAAPVLPARRLK